MDGEWGEIGSQTLGRHQKFGPMAGAVCQVGKKLSGKGLQNERNFVRVMMVWPNLNVFETKCSKGQSQQ